ncbi:hypothetical protein GCM10009599_20640 [Luteococcus peritonei]
MAEPLSEPSSTRRLVTERTTSGGAAAVGLLDARVGSWGCCDMGGLSSTMTTRHTLGDDSPPRKRCATRPDAPRPQPMGSGGAGEDGRGSAAQGLSTTFWQPSDLVWNIL